MKSADAGRSRRRAPRLAALAGASLACAALAIALWQSGDPRDAGRPATRSAIGTGPGDATPGMGGSSSPGSEATLSHAAVLPDGALPPILGEPRPPGPEYCHESHWTRAITMIRESRSGEVKVDELAWRQRGTSGQRGLAAWLSRCRHDGRALKIRSAESGEVLGFYSEGAGYRSTD